MKNSKLALFLIPALLIKSACALEIGEKDIFPPKCAVAPVIDGKLDEPVWKSAAHIKELVKDDPPVPGRIKTEVFLLYDDDNLYVGFRCHEPNMKKLLQSSFHSKRDDEIWNDECVEVFIDADHDHTSLYHFIVNCKGAKYDEIYGDVRWQAANSAWDGIWDAAASLGDDYWEAEFAIPFHALNVLPGKANIIGINFTREKRTTPAEFTSWSGGFHVPQKYGHLRGLDLGSPKVILKEVEWGEILYGKNKIKTTVANQGEKDWQGNLLLEIRDRDNKLLDSFQKEIKVPGGDEITALLEYNWEKDGRHIGLLCLEDGENKGRQPLVSTTLSFPAALAVESAGLLLYQGENGCLLIALNIADFAAFSIETDLVSPQGNNLKSYRIKPASRRISIPVSAEGLPPGSYQLTIKAFLGNKLVSSKLIDVEIIAGF